MIRTILDFIGFCFSISPFLISTIIYVILAIVLAKSIKRNYKAYYWTFGALSVLMTLPILLGFFGVKMPSLFAIPVLSMILMEFSIAAYFIHPLLVIIMYMGALSPKNRSVGKLMSIRKELSIIVGFAVIAHATKRILYSFPKAWSYFADHEEYMSNSRVISEVGSGVTSFVYVLGIVMSVLFLVLWVTSFDAVHRKMGNLKWKKVQKWSYVLYAMLFIHSVGLKADDIINHNALKRMATEQGITLEEVSANYFTGHGSVLMGTKSEESKSMIFRFSDVEMSKTDKSYANIAIYFLVYGSYLYLRVRKAKKRRLKKEKIKIGI